MSRLPFASPSSVSYATRRGWWPQSQVRENVHLLVTIANSQTFMCKPARENEATDFNISEQSDFNQNNFHEDTLIYLIVQS